MDKALRKQLESEVADWHNGGEISSEQRVALLARYSIESAPLTTMIRWLGIFAMICVGMSLLALLAAASGSLALGAGVMAGLSWLALSQGIRLSNAIPQSHAVTGAALTTIGLLLAYCALCLAYFTASSDYEDPVPYFLILYPAAALGLMVAYYSRLRAPLTIGTICLLHALAGPHRHTGLSTFLELQDQTILTVASGAVALLGIYHGRVLEAGTLRSHQGFGATYIGLGLVYLNSTLLSECFEAITFSSAWNPAKSTLAAVCLVEIAIGTAIRDARFVSIGAIFLLLQLAERVFVTLHPTLPYAQLAFVCGVATLALGFMFRSLNRRARIGEAFALRRPDKVRAEIQELVRLTLITPEQSRRLETRYSLSDWDFTQISRTLIGLGTMVGAVSWIVALVDVLAITVRQIVFFVGLLYAAAIATALIYRKRGNELFANAAELLSGVLFLGWSYAVGIYLNTGSHSPTALLLVDAAVLYAMAYFFANSKLLQLAIAVHVAWFFSWIDDLGQSGPELFGIGPYLQFAGLGTAFAAVGRYHRSLPTLRAPQYEDFPERWILSGLLIVEASLCLLSVYGNQLDATAGNRAPNMLEAIGVNCAWGTLNGWLLIRSRDTRVARVALLSAIVQPYTLFFTYIAPHLGDTLSALVAGAAALALAANLEAWTKVNAERARKG